MQLELAKESRAREIPALNLKVIIERGEDGYFVASCPSLKGCWSQGKTREECLESLSAAMELVLDSRRKQGRVAFL